MIITLAALLFIIPLVIFGLRNVWGIHHDAADRMSTLYTPELSFAREKAPERTAYIDPLIKLDPHDDNYVLFATAPHRIVPIDIGESDAPDCDYEYEWLGVDRSSEIARYYNYGYMSLSLHLALSGGVVISGHDTMFLEFYAWTKDNRIDRLFECYGGFRAAYVDEYGNVLGVTEPAELVYDDTQNTAFIADGSSLTLRVWGVPKWQNVILNVLIIAEPCIFAALIAVVIIALIRRTLVNGALDNTDNLGYNNIMGNSPQQAHGE